MNLPRSRTDQGIGRRSRKLPDHNESMSADTTDITALPLVCPIRANEYLYIRPEFCSCFIYHTGPR